MNRNYSITLVIVSFVVGVLYLASDADATILVTVQGNSGPWDVGLNPSYGYGVYANGQNNVNAPATVVGAASGLPFVLGDLLTIASTTPGALPCSRVQPGLFV